jgi:hypothetical protein
VAREVALAVTVAALAADITAAMAVVRRTLNGVRLKYIAGKVGRMQRETD